MENEGKQEARRSGKAAEKLRKSSGRRKWQDGFAFFIQNFLKNPPQNPWKVQHRSELLQANSRFGIQLKPNAEKILLIIWCTYIVSAEEIFVGWLMLTNLQFRFLSIHKNQNWSAPVEQIRRFSENNTDICIQYKDTEYIFSCQGGQKFTKIFWKLFHYNFIIFFSNFLLTFTN